MTNVVCVVYACIDIDGCRLMEDSEETYLTAMKVDADQCTIEMIDVFNPTRYYDPMLPINTDHYGFYRPLYITETDILLVCFDWSRIWTLLHAVLTIQKYCTYVYGYLREFFYLYMCACVYFKIKMLFLRKACTVCIYI